ncbi:hypothetical protein ACNIS5_28080, partial [Escherichia coli]
VVNWVAWSVYSGVLKERVYGKYVVEVFFFFVWGAPPGEGWADGEKKTPLLKNILKMGGGKNATPPLMLVP